LATVTQLRLGHGYFKSYLSRIDENIQTSCTCDRQTPAPHTPQHILLDCNKYQQHRHLLKPVAQNFHLPDVLGSKAGLLAVGRFIGKSGAGTRSGRHYTHVLVPFFSFIAIGSISLMIYNNNNNSPPPLTLRALYSPLA